MTAVGDGERAIAMLIRARESVRIIGTRTLELRIVNDMVLAALAKGNDVEAIELLRAMYESFENKDVTEDLKSLLAFSMRRKRIEPSTRQSNETCQSSW